MHIAVFGGAFDPPHRGHQQVALHLLQQKLVDQVWFVPANDHPFAKNMSAQEHRLAMLATFCTTPQLQISTWELEQPGPSYSILTLEHFAQQHPTNTFTWVMGSDNLKQFTRWHRYSEILERFGVLVYPRKAKFEETFDEKYLLPGMQLLATLPVTDISSTQVRELVSATLDTATQAAQLEVLVTAPIARYIQMHNLYTSQK